MTEERLLKIEKSIDEYWEEDYLDVDIANAVVDNAYALLKEVKRLRGIIEDADTEASLRRHDSFDKINQICSKRDETL